MHTLVVNSHYCPVLGQDVQVEELYYFAGTCTCQIDSDLLSWRCLNKNECKSESCPLFQEYAGTGVESLMDQ